MGDKTSKDDERLVKDSGALIARAAKKIIMVYHLG